MKTLFAFIFSLAISSAFSQDKGLKELLIAQLKNSHNEKNWYVPVNVAVQGISAEQAMWTDGSGNHSVGQLAYHLMFWNERTLKGFQGEKNPNFEGDNTETFDKFDSKQWEEVKKRLDNVMIELEKVIQSANDKQLKEWSSTIMNIGAHNAYHTGQMVFVRKLQGSWDPEKGVK
jgi:uncharacterized damage-inducible protein DinB